MPVPNDKALSAIAWASVLAIGATAHFLGQTICVARGGALSSLLGGTIAGLVLLLAAVGVPRRGELVATGSTRILLLVASGALGFGLAPWLVVTHRYSDAPSGSETIFFTTAAWGLLIVLVAWTDAEERPSGARTMLALLALLGAAGIVADWERPSSFSPLLKFPREEALMLFAGACFAFAVLVLRRSILRYGVRVSAIALASGGLLGAAVLLGATGALPAAARGLLSPESFVVTAAVSWGVVLLALSRLLSSAPLVSASVPLFLPPALLTAGTAIEALTGMMGPRPLVLVPLSASLVVLFLSLLGMAFGDPLAERVTRAFPLRAVPPLLALLAGAAGLASPALEVVVSGSLPTGVPYDVRFAYLGYETVGGLLAFLMAAVLLACAMSGRGPFSARRSLSLLWLGGVAAVGASWSPLSAVPLHTWNGWIPASVQQDFGTEYARIMFTPLSMPWQMVAVSLCVAAAALGVLARPSLGRPRETEGPEVQ